MVEYNQMMKRKIENTDRYTRQTKASVFFCPVGLAFHQLFKLSVTCRAFHFCHKIRGVVANPLAAFYHPIKGNSALMLGRDIGNKVYRVSFLFGIFSLKINRLHYKGIGDLNRHDSINTELSFI